MAIKNSPGFLYISTDHLITLKSSAFEQDGTIPEKYTCYGQDASPPLEWSYIPDETKSFTIFCENPESPNGTINNHWIIFNIPATHKHLPENIPYNREILDYGIRQGINSFGQIGYKGPCPKPGQEHQYIFTIYALNVLIEPEGAIPAAEIYNAMTNHAVGSGKLVGWHSRKK